MDTGYLGVVSLNGAPNQQLSGEWYRVLGLGGELDVSVLVSRGYDDKPRIKLVQIAAGTVLGEHLRAVPLGQIERLLPGPGESVEAQHRPDPLSRRGPDEDPKAFFGRVARTYRYYARRTTTPAKQMADASGIPVATVRRWIKEARQAGALEPGRRGRAG